jgi:N-formylglutamate deformylase
MDWLASTAATRRWSSPFRTPAPTSPVDEQFVSPWRARLDADWWIDRLYAFAESGARRSIRTDISRSVIDVNRDPSGVSLYPGQATTELCPTTTFDGDPLYRAGEPDEAEISQR